MRGTRMLGRPRALVVAASLLVVTGCASPVRKRAVTLAEAGVRVAQATEASMAETGAAVDTYIESQLLLGPLTGRPPLDEKGLATVRRVRSALDARGEVMRRLAAAYTALNAHASFDAAGSVEAGVNGLLGSVDEYGKALGQPPVSPTTGWIVSKAAGGIAGARQIKVLKAASAEIRKSLESVVRLLRKEKEVHASIRRVLAEGQGVTARTYARLGLGRPGALLAQHVGSFGLVYEEKQLDGVLARLRKEPSITGESGKTREDDLNLAIEKVLEFRIERRAELEGEIIDEVLSGLESLAVAHGKLEAEEEIDLAVLAEYLASIRATVDEYRKVSGK